MVVSGSFSTVDIIGPAVFQGHVLVPDQEQREPFAGVSTIQSLVLFRHVTPHHAKYLEDE